MSNSQKVGPNSVSVSKDGTILEQLVSYYITNDCILAKCAFLEL